MPILPMPRRSQDRLKSWVAQIDYFAHGGAFLALVVAATAILLWVLRVDFQFVAGAFLIIHGTTLVRKRIAPTIVQTQPEPAVRATPIRHAIDPTKERGPV